MEWRGKLAIGAGISLAAVSAIWALLGEQFTSSQPEFTEDRDCSTPPADDRYRYENARALNYEMPNHPGNVLPPEYYAGLRERMQHIPEPLLIKMQTGGLTYDEIRLVRDILAEGYVVSVDQNVAFSDGSQCNRKYYADVTSADPRHPGLVMREYPLLRDASPEVQRFVMAHEVGHLLDRVLGLQAHFNALPIGERAHLYGELEQFQKFLQETGRPVNGRFTGPEGIADASSYLLREPELLRLRAPAVYDFLVNQINRDPHEEPNLARLLRVV